MKQLRFTDRRKWRDWLAKNHDREQAGVWLVFYKKHTGKKSLDYDEMVEEALCFGWIDSLIKKLDEDKYVRKVTPRKPKSQWSASNKKRVQRLVKQGLMEEPGLAMVRAAKRSGMWNAHHGHQIPADIPMELKQAFAGNRKAETFFQKLASSDQRNILGWIAAAKRTETKVRRAQQAIELLREGKKLGMK